MFDLSGMILYKICDSLFEQVCNKFLTILNLRFTSGTKTQLEVQLFLQIILCARDWIFSRRLQFFLFEPTNTGAQYSNILRKINS